METSRVGQRVDDPPHRVVHGHQRPVLRVPLVPYVLDLPGASTAAPADPPRFVGCVGFVEGLVVGIDPPGAVRYLGGGVYGP